jgi:type I restriction enzyme, R subunit
MTTDTSEKGLETLIYQAMTGRPGLEPVPETFQEVSPTAAGGTGWLAGWSRDYDRTHALDAPQLFAFLQATQPDEVKKLGIALVQTEREIALLREYRTRLTADVVTGGKLDVRAAALPAEAEPPAALGAEAIEQSSSEPQEAEDPSD